ncbi:hypothetical protein SASPL_142343 [Salvia splendens]|uniref:TF-B3 domain-containing protein n=1 Tax=Salvia splendens TaxID=180675 RepID=A0A8X8WKQ9_SALSN|nr:hypothetical protein SASPL_142343 [Salvia splendens]
MSIEKPSFFKVLATLDFTKQLRLPPTFLTEYDLNLPGTVKLRADDESGRSWGVKVERISRLLLPPALFQLQHPSCVVASNMKARKQVEMVFEGNSVAVDHRPLKKGGNRVQLTKGWPQFRRAYLSDHQLYRFDQAIYVKRSAPPP